MNIDVGRIPDIPVWDYVGLTVGTTSDTYTFKVGGSTGTTIYIVVIEYTDSGKSTIANVTKTFSQEHTLILQPGPSDGVDTWIISVNDNNYGTTPYLLFENLGPYGNYVREVSLLKFDLSGIPVGSVCDSAVLELWGLTSLYSDGVPVYVYSILSGNASWTQLGATWVKRDGINLWAGSDGCWTAGVDYDGTAIGSGFTTQWNGVEPHVADSISLDPAVVETWFGETNANYGMRIFTTTTPSDSLRGGVYSSKSEFSEKRPRLTVKWRNF